MLRVSEATKRNLRRRFYRRRREAIELGQQADTQIENLLIKRFNRLSSVRRFLGLWTTLFVLLFFATLVQLRSLGIYYQSLQPVAGGLYNEGLIGSLTNANPLYASGAADVAVSHLIFSGLLKYDNSNTLSGDLAQNWTVNDAQTHYSVHLRHGVTWQDGVAFSADDVVFTYQTIQNIEAQSSLYSSWEGINVSKQDAYTVNFDLPNPLSAFPYSLTNGIVPAHLLKNIPVEQLRSASFNTTPVGTGPFVWKFVEVSGTGTDDRQQRITLAAFNHYWAGRPKLDGFSVLTFSNDQRLIAAFEKKQLNAMSGLETLPPELAGDRSVQTYVTPLTTAVMVFFNTSHLSDAKVRQALVNAVDRNQLSTTFTYPVKLVDEPLLRGQLGYEPTLAQLPYNFDGANQLLDQAGWTARNSSGQRTKDGQVLQFHLAAQSTTQYTQVAHFLQSQWAKVGVKVTVDYPPSSDDLQTIIADHQYEALLYGINIGVDPDQFAYWDSSQASLTSQGHLNLSEYKSAVADSALESGRTRSDPALRAIKYKNFLDAWRNDAPALALYQPNFLYITRGPVFNYARKADNTGVDRFYNVAGWMIRQKHQDI